MDPITIAMMALGAGKTVKGIFDTIQGKRLAANTILPEYEIPQGVYDNVGMFKNAAQYGIDSSSMNFATSRAQQGLTSSIGAALQLGASPNVIASFNDDYLNFLGDLAVQDSQARWGKIGALANANEALAEQEFIKFGIEDARAKDRLQAATQKSAEGFQNIMGGLDFAVGAYGQQQTRDLYKDQINALNNFFSGASGGSQYVPTRTPTASLPTLDRRTVSSPADQYLVAPEGRAPGGMMDLTELLRYFGTPRKI